MAIKTTKQDELKLAESPVASRQDQIGKEILEESGELRKECEAWLALDKEFLIEKLRVYLQKAKLSKSKGEGVRIRISNETATILRMLAFKSGDDMEEVILQAIGCLCREFTKDRNWGLDTIISSTNTLSDVLHEIDNTLTSITDIVETNTYISPTNAGQRTNKKVAEVEKELENMELDLRDKSSEGDSTKEDSEDV